MGQGRWFKGRQFTTEVILLAVRWYLMFPISYRDLELMLLDRGAATSMRWRVAVDHTNIFRWIQAYAAELEKRIRPHLRTSNGSWRVDDTYVRVKGRWTYLYRAVDSRGQTIDFLLSARRDAAAAKRFFRKALAQPSVSWRLDETYVRIKGKWKYLYRAVDKAGDTVDVLLTAKRDRRAALRFLRKAIGRHGAPEKITIDKSGANAAAIESITRNMKRTSKSAQSNTSTTSSSRIIARSSERCGRCWGSNPSGQPPSPSRALSSCT